MGDLVRADANISLATSNSVAGTLFKQEALGASACWLSGAAAWPENLVRFSAAGSCWRPFGDRSQLCLVH